MANKGDPSYSKGIFLKPTYEMRRYEAILILKEQVRRLIRKIE